jgi:hypothetical protein
MKKIFIILIGVSVLSCTDNQKAKRFGGTVDYHIASNRKLVNVTWKDENDLWVLTRPMKPEDSVDTLIFQQNKGSILSLYGNGSIRFIEHRD